MQERVESAEVLYATESVVRIDAIYIEGLKKEALKNPRSRIRLCTHQSTDDPVHEMLIVHTQDTYVRPHAHVGKTESFHMIEGELDVVLFDPEGNIREIVELGLSGSGRCFYYRLQEETIHTVMIRTPVAIFHETTKGPFKREETLFPNWAPDEHDGKAIRDYVVNLQSRLRSFQA